MVIFFLLSLCPFKISNMITTASSCMWLNITVCVKFLPLEAAVYDLVPEGFTLSAAGWRAVNSYGALAIAAALGGLGYSVVRDKLAELKKEEKEES